MKTSYIFLAPGFEEIEAITPIDILRRAGMSVTVVAVSAAKEITGAHGISLVADIKIDDVQLGNADFMILPGGMPGATHLHENEKLNTLLKEHAANGGKIAAICASPAVVLAPLGLLDGLEATCYPGFEDACKQHGAKMLDRRVVMTPQIITANGPASAALFALSIVANAAGDTKAEEISEQMLY